MRVGVGGMKWVCVGMRGSEECVVCNMCGVRDVVGEIWGVCVWYGCVCGMCMEGVVCEVCVVCMGNMECV